MGGISTCMPYTMVTGVAFINSCVVFIFVCEPDNHMKRLKMAAQDNSV